MRQCYDRGAPGGGLEPARISHRQPAMIQELFSIGPLSISPFGVMMVVAFLSAYLQLRWGFRRLKIGDEEDASAVVLAAGIGGILGAKLYYAALYGDWRLLLGRFGLVWYGGFLLGAAAVIWTVRRRRLPIARTLDVSTLALTLGYAFGRVGCFLVGDDYGMPTDLPWGVKIPYGLPGPTTAAFMRSEYGADIPLEVPGHELVAVHPTQLYETLLALGIWAVGLALLRRSTTVGRPAAGGTATVVVALMAAERFGVEFLRAKDDRYLGMFTLAQGISLLIVVGLAVLAYVLRKRREAA